MNEQLELFPKGGHSGYRDWELENIDLSEPVRGQSQPQTKTLTLSASKLDEIIRAAHGLSDRDLEQLLLAIAALLNARELGYIHEAETTKTRPLTEAQVNKSGHLNAGHFEWKHIKGYGPYLYLRWCSGGKHRSTYLGKKKT